MEKQGTRLMKFTNHLVTHKHRQTEANLRESLCVAGESRQARTIPPPLLGAHTIAATHVQRAASQGRRRAILWGALSGVEQLPPFPAATHRVRLPVCAYLHAGLPGGGLDLTPMH